VTAFVSFCNRLSSLSDSAILDLEAVLNAKSFKKGEYILQQGNTCRNLYFLESGLVKMFCYTDSKEFIMNFFQEESMLTILDSFPFQVPSEYNILALENTSVQYISNEALNRLCTEHHCMETFYRKILSHATSNMMHRIREMLIQTHLEHYQQYLKDNSQLVRRLSLGDLACYLGITQVSLSRIRAKM
jgi:CRP-like cAMP-binding protein